MLRTFFFPKSVAIVGASRDPEKFGHVILKNFKEEFKGKIYPINPKTNEILGLKCYGSVKEVRDKIDLVVITVPASISNEIVKECTEKKIPSVIVITAGYKEIGAEGIKREIELKSIIKDSKTKVLGPNCIGVYDPYGKVDTLFLPEYKLKRSGQGSIAFISQSGAFGSAILDWAATEGIGISRFISYGNMADVDEVDLMNYLANDKQSRAIIAYIEGIKNGRKLLETVKKITKRKPIVILKAGKSEGGIKAASSHTGSLAGSYEIFQAAMKQGGVIEANNVEDLFDYGRVLAYQSPPNGNRIGIVTNGGGFGVMCADACKRFDMELANFSKETIIKMKKVMPSYSTIHNPLDLIGDADAERYEVALNALINDKNVDGIVATVLLQTSTLEPEVIDFLSSINGKSKKPLIVCSAGGEYSQLLLKNLEREGIPSYPSPTRAMKAMKVLVNYGKVRYGL
jgi:acetyl coenzyme A synthetase (ADP forming)-like protein